MWFLKLLTILKVRQIKLKSLGRMKENAKHWQNRWQFPKLHILFWTTKQLSIIFIQHRKGAVCILPFREGFCAFWCEWLAGSASLSGDILPLSTKFIRTPLLISDNGQNTTTFFEILKCLTYIFHLFKHPEKVETRQLTEIFHWPLTRVEQSNK